MKIELTESQVSSLRMACLANAEQIKVSAKCRIEGRKERDF